VVFSEFVIIIQISFGFKWLPEWYVKFGLVNIIVTLRVSMQRGEFFDELSDCHLLKNDCADKTALKVSPYLRT
jgi:hypothetical protein